MTLHLSKFRLNLAGLALMALVGCGGEAGPSTPTVDMPSSGTAVDPSVDLQAFARVAGHYRDGHLSFDEVQSVGADGPGLAPQGFGTFTLRLLTFATEPGDGVGVSGIPEGCSATQYCARVSITNNTGRAIQSLYSEITDYFNVQPTTATPTWAGTPFTRSTAYRSVFVNGAGTIQAADFGDFAVGQTKTVSFIFEIGGATNFDFHVTEYATFPRSFISGSGIDNVAATNACTAGTQLTNADDAETAIVLPFPHTLVDRTYDRAVVGSNGYVLLYATGSATPTLGLGNNNTAIAPAYQIPGYYTFWDDLAYDAGNGAVCYVVVGTKPNRTLYFTWSNAKISNNQPTLPKTFTTEKITYSVAISEQSDNFRFIYALPSGGITALTRGGSATIMFNYYRAGALEHQVYNYNAPKVPPASAASYPYALNGAQYNPNP